MGAPVSASVCYDVRFVRRPGNCLGEGGLVFVVVRFCSEEWIRHEAMGKYLGTPQNQLAGI